MLIINEEKNTDLFLSRVCNLEKTKKLQLKIILLKKHYNVSKLMARQRKAKAFAF